MPIINEIGFNNHQMDEFWMLDIFKLLRLNSDDIFLDFGANVGQSLLKWKAINPNQPYIGFEALPDCVEYLNSLIQVNGFNNTEIIDKVISTKSGNTSLYLHYNDPTDRTASMLKSNLKVVKQIAVNAISFNDFITTSTIDFNKIKLCKIDIEGSEDCLLYSMEKFLQDQLPVIIVEILSHNYTGDSLNKLFEYIGSLDYKTFRVIKNRNRLKYLTKVKDKNTSFSIEESDYLLLPKSYPLKSFNPYIKVDY